ncbi:hypothetical protein GT360_13350 [Vibrio astriarenae]|uniref:Uncharacterized protein n=1 Tax=Vibrio astriarenae TaxID=1481923 RepID=A0A7Z2YES2_9VIBR|nr:hypothetical protein [Vibrio astriarenae]QIA64414.1 hypothetical protein GT360_13350 [Vibrio astriarenae]
MPQPLLSLIKKSFLCFTITALAALVIHADVRLLDSKAGEDSLIEYCQDLILLFLIVMLFVAGRRIQAQRSFLFLMSAFFSCLLIRELDGVFDQITHGFWKYPAWIIAIGACYYSLFLHREATLDSLAQYMQHPSFGLMLGAMSMLMVFSRLFGMGDLWQHLLEGGYARSAKNTAEEGTELVSYTLIACASVWYCLSLSKESK